MTMHGSSGPPWRAAMRCVPGGSALAVMPRTGQHQRRRSAGCMGRGDTVSGGRDLAHRVLEQPLVTIEKAAKHGFALVQSAELRLLFCILPA